MYLNVFVCVSSHTLDNSPTQKKFLRSFESEGENLIELLNPAHRFKFKTLKTSKYTTFN